LGQSKYSVVHMPLAIVPIALPVALFQPVRPPRSN
jgi:hypothetical protein